MNLKKTIIIIAIITIVFTFQSTVNAKIVASNIRYYCETDEKLVGDKCITSVSFAATPDYICSQGTYSNGYCVYNYKSSISPYKWMSCVSGANTNPSIAASSCNKCGGIFDIEEYNKDPYGSYVCYTLETKKTNPEVVYTCPEDYEVIGNTCNKNVEKPAEFEYYCPDGYTYTNYVCSGPDIKIKKSSYTYDGKVKNPSVVVKNLDYDIMKNKIDYKIVYQSGRKYVGKYYVKIIYINKYSEYGSRKVWFMIKPKGTVIKSLTSGKNKITVRIKLQKIQTTNYQIAYSTSKSFKSYKTISIKNTTKVKTIKQLKSNKKYYVKIRTYKSKNGQRYYSKWSKALYVKTK